MIAEQVRAAASRLAKSVIKGPFKPAGLYQYTSADGSPSYWRFRADLESGRKVIRPFRRNGDRYVLGEPAFPDGKPLYRLNDLIRRTEETVWFVEGEKCADALAKFGMLATTSGSASSDEDADYSPLAGRVVVLWADYDPDTFPDGKEHLLGQKHMRRVAEKLTALGCHVEMIDIRKLGLPQTGSDCVDWLNNDPDARRQDIEALPRCAPVVEETAHIPLIPHIPEHERDEVFQFGETNTPEIPTSLLPGWLGTYAEAVRLNTQTPSGMSVMLALSTTAACVQRRFHVSPFGDSYIEPLSLWTVTALPPASRKTAVISAFTAPLSEWERNQAAERSSEISRREAERKVTQRRMDKLEVEAAKEDDPIKRNKLIKEMGELKDGMPAEILLPRLWTNDATPERLQMLLVEHGERMSVLSDEGVIFAIMGGLYNDGKANLDVFLKAHAGSPVRVDRASRSAHLDNPALTFGLAVQPQILSDFSQGDMRRFRGIGVLARFLYCLPESNIGQRDVTRQDAVPSDVMEAYRRGIAGLLAIEPNMIEGIEVPRTIKFHSQARRQWLAFCKYIETNQGRGKPFESIQDWTGKLPGAAARIAGLIHVVLHGSAAADMEIEASTMEKGLDLAHLLIKHAQAVFQLIGRDQCVADGNVVWDWLRRSADKLQNGYVKRSDIHRALHNRFPQVERLVKAMGWLQAANVVSGPEKLPTRKPTLIYHVNPKALEQ